MKAQPPQGANPNPLSYQQADERYVLLAQRRRDTQEKLTAAMQEVPKLETTYRKRRASMFKEARERGEPIEAAKIMTDADASDAKEEWLLKRAEVRALEEKLLEIDAARGAWNRRVDWSKQIAADSGRRP